MHHLRTPFFCLLVWFFTMHTARAQQDSTEFIPWNEFQYAGQHLYTIDGSQPRRTTQIKPFTAALIGAGTAGLIAGLHIYQANTIWAKQASFRIVDDWDVELNADKGGHFVGSYLESKLATDALMGAGYDWDFAVICGGLMGLGYQFYVEVLDGYGVNWGFSPSDMMFNVLGSGFYIARHYSPFLQNFTPKADFFPSPWIGEKTRKYALSVIDDYSAWTWWLSINVHNLLPEPLQQWYPSWLNIAVGYAARNIDWDDASRKYIISFDFDLEKILPEGGTFWNWLRQYVNMIKLPAPAIEFSPNHPPRFYLLYPFKL